MAVSLILIGIMLLAVISNGVMSVEMDRSETNISFEKPKEKKAFNISLPAKCKITSLKFSITGYKYREYVEKKYSSFENFTYAENLNISGDRISLEKVDEKKELNLLSDYTKNLEMNDVIKLAKKDSYVFLKNVRINASNKGMYDPAICVDSSSRVHIVWDDMRDWNHNIYYSYSDGNTNFSKPIRVDDTGRKNYMQDSPDVACGVDGKIHIVWRDNRTGYSKIYYTYSISEGVFAKNIPISDNDAGTEALNPSLCVDKNGKVHVVWEDNRDGYFRIRYAYGGPYGFSKSIGVGEDTGKDQGKPTIATDDRGNIYVAWFDSRNGDFDIYCRKISNGVLKEEVRVDDSEDTNTFQGPPSIDVDSKGRIYIAWHDDRLGIFRIWYSYSDDGIIFYKNRAVDLSISAEHNQYSPEIFVDSNDRVHVVWYDSREGSRDIFHAYSNDRGKSFINVVRVSDDINHEQYGPVGCVDPNGYIHVAWWDDRTSSNFEIYYSKGIHPYIERGTWISEWYDLTLTPYLLKNISIIGKIPNETSVDIKACDEMMDDIVWKDLPITPNSKFLKIKIFMRGTSTQTPIIQGLRVEYVYFKERGEYISSPLNFNYTVEKVSLLTDYYGDISFYVFSNEGWKKINPGEKIEIFSKNIKWKCIFRGETHRTPYITSAIISANLISYPSYVSIKWNGRVIWSYDDIITEKINTPNLVNKVTASENISISVNTSSPGSLIISLIINYNLPPEIISRSPEDDIIMNENDEMIFTLIARDPDGDKLNIRWYLDDNIVSSGFSSYIYQPDYESHGRHTIKCVISDEFFVKEYSWNVTVNNVNRAPRIISTSPDKITSVKPLQKIIFSVDAYDPDDDKITYKFLVDGVNVNSNENELVWIFENPGIHTVKCIVSDGFESVNYTWHVEVEKNENTDKKDNILMYNILGVGMLAVAIALFIRILIKRRS